jgi:CSLREA domain-containing protein
MQFLKTFLKYTLGILFSCLFLVNFAQAATFTVTKSTDTNDGTCDSTDCSLREAIVAANATTAEDTIVFDAATNGSAICLSITGTDENAAATGDLNIRNPLTITGNGANQTIIDGGNTLADGASTTCASSLGDRIFWIRPDVSGNVTLDGLTIKNGYSTFINNPSGGGIYLSDTGTGNLTVKNSEISYNVASGEIGGWGGGISATNSNLTIENSRIAYNQLLSSASANYALNGGGIYCGANGTFTMKNSLVDHNQVIASVGVLSPTGGGIHLESTTVKIQNSTISNNQARYSGSTSRGSGGGLRLQSNVTVSLYNVTLADNQAAFGPGVSINGLPTNVVNLYHSLIADNITLAGSAADCFNTADAPVYIKSDSIIETTTNCTTVSDGGSLISGAINMDDLADSGDAYAGVTLLTQAISGDSIARTSTQACVDMDGASLSVDQRGFARSFEDGICDIGAYEIYCGDGIVQSSEACDDGNLSEDDSCNNTCQSQSYYYVDFDIDGYGNNNDAGWHTADYDEVVSGYMILTGSDCNDTNTTIHPNATEACGDGIDSDCNTDPNTFSLYADADGDSEAGLAGTDFNCDVSNSQTGYLSTAGSDCNDGDAAVNSSATEVCGNDTDEDCSGTADACAATVTDDDGDGVLDDSVTTTATTTTTDTDGDGVADTDDAFPSDATETLDTDADGTGNNADTDDDGDGVLDDVDSDPLDSSVTTTTSTASEAGGGCQLRTAGAANPSALAMIFLPALLIVTLRLGRSLKFNK